jgi:hypothetical protein
VAKLPSLFQELACRQELNLCPSSLPVHEGYHQSLSGMDSIGKPVIMKTRLFLVLAFAVMIAACSEHSCPTYTGSRTSYSPPKMKSFKTKSTARSSSSGKKQTKKAEQ